MNHGYVVTLPQDNYSNLGAPLFFNQTHPGASPSPNLQPSSQGVLQGFGSVIPSGNLTALLLKIVVEFVDSTVQFFSIAQSQFTRG